MDAILHLQFPYWDMQLLVLPYIYTHPLESQTLFLLFLKADWRGKNGSTTFYECKAMPCKAQARLMLAKGKKKNEKENKKKRQNISLNLKYQWFVKSVL